MRDADVVRHFTGVAAQYTRLRASWPLGMLRRQEIAALRELVRPQPGARVLDVGCGDGETLSWLTELGARPVGIDVVYAMAAHCRQRGLSVAVQDMEQLGVRARFDWVLCIGSLEFTAQPKQVIASLAACVRPHGRFVLLFPRRSWLGTLYATYHRAHGVRIRIFSNAEIRGFMLAAGLEPLAGWRDCWLSTIALATRGGGASGS
jgi:2-polyprenyl-3-methyl-5-hydroxy-6-metoxy-1,4-benzoquinol methylase